MNHHRWHLLTCNMCAEYVGRPKLRHGARWLKRKKFLSWWQNCVSSSVYTCHIHSFSHFLQPKCHLNLSLSRLFSLLGSWRDYVPHFWSISAAAYSSLLHWKQSVASLMTLHCIAVEKHYDPSYSRSMKSHTERFKPPFQRVVLSGLNQEQLDQEWFSLVDKSGTVQGQTPHTGSEAASIF